VEYSLSQLGLYSRHNHRVNLALDDVGLLCDQWLHGFLYLLLDHFWHGSFHCVLDSLLHLNLDVLLGFYLVGQLGHFLVHFFVFVGQVKEVV
jgi:hypothetical protein